MLLEEQITVNISFLWFFCRKSNLKFASSSSRKTLFNSYTIIHIFTLTLLIIKMIYSYFCFVLSFFCVRKYITRVKTNNKYCIKIVASSSFHSIINWSSNKKMSITCLNFFFHHVLLEYYFLRENIIYCLKYFIIYLRIFMYITEIGVCHCHFIMGVVIISPKKSLLRLLIDKWLSFLLR